MYVRMNECMYVFMRVCVCGSTYICKYVCICICMYVADVCSDVYMHKQFRKSVPLGLPHPDRLAATKSFRGSSQLSFLPIDVVPRLSKRRLLDAVWVAR